VSRVVGAYLNRRVPILFGLGFASGLPYLLTGSTLSAWMTSAAFPLGAIGLLSLVTAPYSLRILWAPLLDRFRLPLLGRRRGWMLLFQLALIATIAALGLPNPKSAPGAIVVLAAAVAFFSASQDTVSDAYRTDLLRREERAAGTATFIFGYRSAMLLSGGVALVLADHLSFRGVYLLMACAMLVGVVCTFLAPEPEQVEAPRTLTSAVVDPFLDFFRRRGAVAILFFITLYRLGDVVANVMVMPFLLSLKFSNSEVGFVYKVAGTAATIVGTLVGGALVARLGLFRSLLGFAAGQALANTAYSTLALVGKSHAMLWVAVAADNLFTGLSIAALDAFLMALCNKRFSALQYALLASASGVAGRMVGAGSGYLAAAVGWPLFFVATMTIASPAIILLLRLRPTVDAADAGAGEGLVLASRESV
jgi:PAT family beta-lactamase induction signal transducer AmpG